MVNYTANKKLESEKLLNAAMESLDFKKKYPDLGTLSCGINSGDVNCVYCDILFKKQSPCRISLSKRKEIPELTIINEITNQKIRRNLEQW